MAGHLSTLPFTLPCPTVQPETYCSDLQNLHVPCLLTAHIWLLGFCHCWSDRLKQSSGPCPAPERQRSFFQAPDEDIFVRMALAHLVHYGGSPVMFYTNLHFDIDIDAGCVDTITCAKRHLTPSPQRLTEPQSRGGRRWSLLSPTTFTITTTSWDRSPSTEARQPTAASR